MRSSVLASMAALVFALVACGDDDAPGPTTDLYRAKIVRTAYGIPHVTADDWGSLGYGSGYAYAQDNYCVLMREVVRANGETGRYFAEEDANLADDFVYTFLNTEPKIREFLASTPANLQQLVRGYAAGLNRYLAETGVSALPEGPEGCRDAAWARPVTEVDLGKVYRKLVLRASAGALTQVIVAAQPPSASMASLDIAQPNESTPFDTSAIDLPPPEELGSNAYAIGSEASQSGAGILLGNPHFPWAGSLRWFVSHLTIPGQYDVMGASLQGVPLINIGFNSNVAWSHTVSTGQRFTFYELHLLEDDPMKYQYDGEVRSIEPHEVTIQVQRADGTLEARTDTLYTSHYGFVVELGALNDLVGGWPTVGGSVFSFRDANIDNTRVFEQFLGFGRAQSVDDMEQSLKLIGLPWVNTITADRAGNALYADVTTVPNVTASQLDDCADSLLAEAITGFGRATLNGSRSECEWGTDPDGPPGLLGFAHLPTLRNRTFVANSNDSYWLSNPSQLLTGFSPLIGGEEIPQSIRTRLAFVQAEERIAGTDGLPGTGFTVDLLQSIFHRQRDHSAELVRDDVVAVCEAVTDWSAGDCGPDGTPYTTSPAQAQRLCGILADWDRSYTVESVGAGPWREIWARLQRTENLWAVPFDAADPVHTPNTLNTSEPAVVEAVRCALGGIVDLADASDVPLDRPWGELQFRNVGDERIPIPGGPGASAFSVIESNWVDGEGYSDIFTGNSYIQTVTWDDDPDCPDAYAVLTYSQSTNPASPYYADQTRLYSEAAWNRMPFCAADVAAATISEMEITNAQ